jgi:hypothetical protein
MKMTLKIFILTIVWTSLLSQTGSIKGYIHNGRENKGIPFCSIGIKQLNISTTSDKYGNFKFEKIPFGTYDIQAFYVGYGDTSVTISIQNRNPFELRLELPKACKYDKNRKNKTCPTCNKSDQTIPIVYGLMVTTDNSQKKKKGNEFYTGGCNVTTCDPNWFCKRDSIKF